MILLQSLLIAVGIFVFSVSVFGALFSAPCYKGPVSDHFNGKRFFTPGGLPAKNLLDVLKWGLSRKPGKWERNMNMTPGPTPASRVEGGQLMVTFVNHSTFLIQTNGLNILTDPVWAKRTSPFSWAGPQRMRPPGIRLEDLPKIDVILQSHNHYDHLDIATMKKIFEVHRPMIITPLGVKAYLEANKITSASDLDWWQEIGISNSVNVQAVPAQHFSGRGTRDRDKTLWCGYVIRRNGGAVYFAGDSGYHEHIFKEIGDRCGPIKLAIIPIGAFRPRWFMSPIHCSPEEAVRIHMDVKAEKSIASHFGTFPLADDGQDEPVQELRKGDGDSGR